MLFGLGEGLGFIFWKMKTMDFPFIGGRVKPDILTANIARNLQLKLIAKETSSQQKAWENVKQLLDIGKIVGLKLDCYYLEYFSNPIHFAGHYVALYGYDNTHAFLIDTKQQGGMVKSSLKNMALARAAKGPMSSNNLCYTMHQMDKPFYLSQAILTAIKNNTNDYLNPPITNIGYKGILKTSEEIKKWFGSTKNIDSDFRTTAMLMERAGTGGALFRNLYRDFLKESYELLGLDSLKKAYQAFIEIAKLWTMISELFVQVAKTKDYQYIQQASAILKQLSQMEHQTMQMLHAI